MFKLAIVSAGAAVVGIHSAGFLLAAKRKRVLFPELRLKSTVTWRRVPSQWKI